MPDKTSLHNAQEINLSQASRLGSKKFAKLPLAVLSDRRLTLRQLKVLCALFSFADADGVCWPSKQALSERCAVSTKYISACTAALAQFGWLTKSGKGGFAIPARYVLRTGTSSPDSSSTSPESGPDVEQTTSPRLRTTSCKPDTTSLDPRSDDEQTTTPGLRTTSPNLRTTSSESSPTSLASGLDDVRTTSPELSTTSPDLRLASIPLPASIWENNQPQFGKSTSLELGLRKELTIELTNELTKHQSQKIPAAHISAENPIPISSRADARLAPEDRGTANDAETELQAACRITWHRYRTAYQQRYGVPPLRNRTVNSQVKQFVRRVGIHEASLIAEWFIVHNATWYVRQGHTMGALLHDAEKLRTEWATGRALTETATRQLDSTQSNFAACADAKRLLNSRRACHG